MPDYNSAYTGAQIDAAIAQAQAAQQPPSEGAFVNGDKTKLDAIEAGATADQTGAEIKALYEAEADTNAFTDAEKDKVGHLSVTQAVDLDAIETRVNELDASVVLKGLWGASAGTFPGAGSAQAGWSYIVSVAGTVDGQSFAVNDRIVAITNDASTSTFASNWHKLDYSDEVLSVAGRTGIVVLTKDDIADLDYANIAKKNVAQTFTAAQGTTITALTDAASIATDASLSNAFSVTLAGNRTLANPSPIVAGNTYIWIIRQDATGSRTLAYGSYFKFPGGTAPTLSTAASSIDRIVAFAASTTELICNAELGFS